LIAAVVDIALGTAEVFGGIVVVALLLPNLAVSVRRLHDAGHSGWWLLIGVIPVIGTIVVLVFTLQASKPPNQWGDGPDGRVGESPALA
jgi:uncharacterized membrane protein YhaH (DUF805 family)